MNAYLQEQIRILKDLDAKAMVKEVEKFSRSENHGSVAALLILSHGNKNGQIMGNTLEHLDCCTITEVAEAFDSEQLKGKPKVSLVLCWRLNN